MVVGQDHVCCDVQSCSFSAFRRLQYGKVGTSLLYRTASDEKLGVGLGTRLGGVARVAFTT